MESNNFYTPSEALILLGVSDSKENLYRLISNLIENGYEYHLTLDQELLLGNFVDLKKALADPLSVTSQPSHTF